MNIAKSPPIIPKVIWLKATEEKRAPSLASNPRDAEEKIRNPKIINNIMIVSKVLSMPLSIINKLKSNCN